MYKLNIHWKICGFFKVPYTGVNILKGPFFTSNLPIKVFVNGPLAFKVLHHLELAKQWCIFVRNGDVLKLDIFNYSWKQIYPSVFCIRHRALMKTPFSVNITIILLWVFVICIIIVIYHHHNNSSKMLKAYKPHG